MRLSKVAIGIVTSALVASYAISATNEVTSVNAVGYIKIDVGANKLGIVGTQFLDMTTNNPTVKDVLGTNAIPSGTKVYIFNGTAYNTETYSFGAWSPGTNVISKNTGFWIKSSVATNFTLKGEVPTTDTLVLMRSGLNLVTYPFPVGSYLTNSVIGKGAISGDKVYYYNTATANYVTYTFSFGSWSPSTLFLNPGDGFWYKSAASTNKLALELVPYTL